MMSSVGQPPGEIRATVLDRQAIADFVRGVAEMRRARLENFRAVVEQCIKVNENGASYYEKLLLLDGGTIALSLTLLGALATRTPGAHVPRIAFFCCVCPAWVLLLASIFCCRSLMASFHNINRNLVEQVSLMHSSDLAVELSQLSAKLSKNLQGEIRVETETHDISWFFGGLSSLLNKEAEEGRNKINELTQRAAKVEIRKAAKVATGSTSFALMLLCIFAVKVFA
jgi:hypothetical protein